MRVLNNIVIGHTAVNVYSLSELQDLNVHLFDLLHFVAFVKSPTSAASIRW
jgi:hypothetical protein